MTKLTSEATLTLRDQLVEVARGVQIGGAASTAFCVVGGCAAKGLELMMGQLETGPLPPALLSAAAASVVLTLVSTVPLVRNVDDRMICFRQPHTPRPNARRLGYAFAGLVATGVAACTFGLLSPKPDQAPQTAAPVTAPQCAATAPRR